MKKQGLSVIEIILAVAIFVIIASGMTTTVLQGLSQNQTGLEMVIANQYASEGIEAVRSIKNQQFSLLANTTGTGLVINGGVWSFGGINNVFDKYTRIITITDVYRDMSGAIVPSGGTLDPDSKKIVSSVAWNITPLRSSSIELVTYVTNWKAISLNITPTITPTIAITPTTQPTLTPTPTVTPSATCQTYCQSLGGYTSGICRQNRNRCIQNGEVYQAGGNIYCPTSNACCCK